MSFKLGPYNLNQIYQGDCLNLMPGIPDGSIDMILADLPYGTTACHWDSIIPLDPLWTQYKRIIKPNGAIVLTASQSFTSMLVMSNLEWFKYEWVWDKKTATGGQNSSIMPMKAHENVLIFGNGVLTYNPQMEDFSLDEIAKMRNHSVMCPAPQIGGGIHTSTGWFEGKQKYPRSVIRVNGITPVSQEKKDGRHPTQKPVALFAYLIRTYTNPGELVLDNVIGSGTTAIAAIETGRNWLGFEKDADYYQIAKKRIEERMKQPFLPGVMESKPEPTQLELA